MTSRFKNSRDRVKRAAEHARAFESEWGATLNPGSVTPELCQDEKGGWFRVCAKLSESGQIRISKNTFALEVGELAYQLRAALDGLIWDTVSLVQGFEPPSDADEARWLEFPILNGRIRDFKKCGLNRFPFPEPLREWLGSIQPDSGEKPEGDPDRGLKSTLENIHNLARFDRHRRLRAVAAIPSDEKIAVETTPPGGKIVAHEWVPCNLFGGQRELVRFKVECAGGLAPYRVQLNTRLTFHVSVEDIELYDGEHVGVQLGRFIGAVERVIDRFDEEML